MDVATSETVLGNFNDISYTDPYNDVTSRFFTRNAKYFVETEGPDGKPGTFEITHTFGVFPLQQYLVPFPGGRLQCLNIAWDARDGKWYRLPPYEVQGAGDWLGTGTIASYLREYRDFNEARTFIHGLGLKSQTEWRMFCKGEMPDKGKLPEDIPANPQRPYKNNGWNCQQVQ